MKKVAKSLPLLVRNKYQDYSEILLSKNNC